MRQIQVSMEPHISSIGDEVDLHELKIDIIGGDGMVEDATLFYTTEELTQIRDTINVFLNLWG